jgi:hypothetical protein
VWVSYIWILNVGNGGNGIRNPTWVVLLEHNLSQTSMHTLK